MSPIIHLSAAAASALLSAIWQGTIVTALVALILRMLPGIPAAIRSAIWTVIFAILLGLHFVSSAASQTTGADYALHVSSRWSVALVALWLGCSIFRAGEFIFSAIRLAQIARQATPSDALQISNGLRRYTLCISPDVDRPSVLGFWSPRILLPTGLIETLTTAELQQLLLHETEHLRRSDDWTNLLQKLALVVFPLNPVLFWVERRMCLERELACDDRVLATCPTRKAYATCLTRIAEHGIFKRGMALALGAFGKQSELATRIHRILGRPARRMGRSATGFATAALLAGVAAGSLSLARSPSLISFAPGSTADTVVATAPPTLQRDANAPRATLVSALGMETRPVRVLKAKQRRRRVLAPADSQWIDTAMRDAFEPEPRIQPRKTLTVAGQQVHPMYVLALSRYAALRTPDGWILIQL